MEIAVLLEDLDILHRMNAPDGPYDLHGHILFFVLDIDSGKVHLGFEDVNQYRRIIDSDHLSSLSGRLIQLFLRQCNQFFFFSQYGTLETFTCIMLTVQRTKNVKLINATIVPITTSRHDYSFKSLRNYHSFSMRVWTNTIFPSDLEKLFPTSQSWNTIFKIGDVFSDKPERIYTILNTLDFLSGKFCPVYTDLRLQHRLVNLYYNDSDDE